MARASGKAMKVDVALPLDIFDAVVRLAKESDAPIHHRSGEPVLSPTIVRLIGLGIHSIEDNPELLTAPIGLTHGPDPRISALVDKVRILEDKLGETDSPTGINIEDVQAAIETTLSPIQNQTQLLGEATDELRGDLGKLRSTVDDAASKQVVTEVLKRLDRLESSINGARAKPKATSPPKAASTNGLDQETTNMVRRLQANPSLAAVVRAGVADGLRGKALCEYIFEHGHGPNDNAKPFDSTLAGRIVKAIGYLDEQEAQS